MRAILATGADPDADRDNTFHVHPIHSAWPSPITPPCARCSRPGANPNVHQEGGFTPLHTAAHNDDATLARMLLDHGADPDRRPTTPARRRATWRVRALLSP